MGVNVRTKYKIPQLILILHPIFRKFEKIPEQLSRKTDFVNEIRSKEMCLLYNKARCCNIKKA